jgi:hypothetical protein
MKNIKILGLALIAMCAMSSVAASSALAVEFHAEEAPVGIMASQTTAQVFTANAGPISCKEASFTGESANAVTPELRIFAEYNNCTFLGVANVKVNMGGCHYVFHAGGTVDVVGATCATNPISFSAEGCTVTVGPQNGLGPIKYVNKGAGKTRDVEVEANVSGIKYTQTGIGCVLQGTFANGTYKGSARTIGRNEGIEQQGVWVE